MNEKENVKKANSENINSTDKQDNHESDSRTVDFYRKKWFHDL